MPDELLPPDTSKAVNGALSEMLLETLGILDVINVSHLLQLANASVTADRKALADAGWTLAPVIKITDAQLDRIEQLREWDSASALVEYLQSLGLPIEVAE